MKRLKFFLTFLILLLPLPAFSGTAFYVDLDATYDGNGSFAMPWNKLSSVNDHVFSNGDDVYFKAGTSSGDSPEVLSIDWHGVDDEDRTIIGCYWNDGGLPNTDCTAKIKPILDGANRTIPNPDTYQGLIYFYNKAGGYVTIQDLHIDSSGFNGVVLNKVNDHNIVQRLYIRNVYGNGITIAQTSYNIIQDNVVERASYNRSPGVGIHTNGANNENSTHHNIIRRNTVYWCYEGIGVYKGAQYDTVEKNRVFDNRSFHIYVANSRNATVRYNLVYESSNDFDNNPDYMIGTDCEGHESHVIKTTGYAEIYGNLIAGGKRGVFILNHCEWLGISQRGNRIFNNTIVDCVHSFYFGNSDGIRSDNLITNNISWTITPGDSYHSDHYSPVGVIWNNNNFDDPVSGMAANNSKIYDPGLKKTSGWRLLSGGDVDGPEFSLTPDSRNRDNGVSIIGYDNRIYVADYTADPINVKSAAASAPSIGAWTGNSSTCLLDANFQQAALENGIAFYTDRTYTLTGVPSEYIGLELIKTPDDDCDLAEESGYLTFELSANATVYVAFDSRVVTLPDWMSGFHDTGDKIYTSLSTQPFLTVYSKSYSAGECVDLGANKAAGFSGGTVSNFIVFYASPPLCKFDFNNDGRVDESDLDTFTDALGAEDCTFFPDYCDCDTDGDEDVDGADLAILTVEFGRTDCPRKSQ